MEDKAGEADAILNRLNVALARSQRLVNSWLPPKPQGEESAHADDEDDENFKAMTELGGIGSSVAYDDDDSPTRPLHRRKLALDDKLLEQLMGKKGAQAHRKSREVGKSMSVGRHAAPKPLASRAKQSREVQSDDDEESGRSAAFKSRRTGQPQKRAMLESSPIGDAENGATAHGISALSQPPELEPDEGRSVDMQPRPQAKPAKRATTSYLDELLAQKGKKKRKEKMKSKHGNSS